MTSSQVKSEFKRSMAIVMIVSLFLISWTPGLTAATISNVRDASNSDEKVHFIKTIFGFIFTTNSLINPILYFWKLHKFRFSQTYNSQETTLFSSVVTRVNLIFRLKFSVE